MNEFLQNSEFGIGLGSGGFFGVWSRVGLQNAAKMVLYRLRVSESGRHTPTQKFAEYPPGIQEVLS